MRIVKNNLLLIIKFNNLLLKYLLKIVDTIIKVIKV